MKSWNTKQAKALLEAVLLLDSQEEALAFFRDLLTEQEIEEFANRWRVARLLAQEVPYTEIEETTGMSSTTIARISKALQGKIGGYRSMLEVAHHNDDSTES